MTDIFKPDIDEITYLRMVNGPVFRGKPMAQIEPCDALTNFEANNPNKRLEVKVITDPDDMPGSGCRSQTCKMRDLVNDEGKSLYGGASMTCTVCAREISITPRQ